MATQILWTCPTCQHEVASAFCPSCGEKSLQPKDLFLRSLLAQAVATFTNIDGKVIRSFRALVFKPGSLTFAFLIGKRKAFVAALPLFLLANVLFFATQSISPIKIFSSPLASHLQLQDWKELAQALVEQKLASTGEPLSIYTARFDRAVALNAKSLVILMIAPLLVLLPLLFRRANRPYVFHAVFALHVYAFNLVLLSALLLLTAAMAVLNAVNFVQSSLADHLLFAIYLLGNAAYLYAATRVAYGSSGPGLILKSVGLTLIAAVSVVGYRFVLFLITLYAT
jgi:Protein of unknown function (DUF3667)